MITIKISEQKDDIFIMKMMDNNEHICTGTIKIGQACQILSITKIDDLGYSMGKALLNLADRRGIKEVTSNNKDIFIVLEKLGFIHTDNGMYLSLINYFSTKCEK